MPNFYAHQKFGGLVVKQLPSQLRSKIEKERPAFDLGCLGPDPLFFYHPLTPNQVRREGLAMHKQSALPVFEKLKKAAKEELPMSMGFSAGFLCHLALDSACHGYVDRRAEQGDITHLAMEAEFDRMLAQADHLGSPRLLLLPSPPVKEVFTAASRAYQHVTPHQAEASYRAMRRDCSLMLWTYGTSLARGLDRLAAKVPPLRGAAGMLPGKAAAASSEETNRILLQLFEQAVSPTADQIARFFEAVSGGGPLDRWLDRDFGGAGEIPEEQDGGEALPLYEIR